MFWMLFLKALFKLITVIKSLVQAFDISLLIGSTVVIVKFSFQVAEIEHGKGDQCEFGICGLAH